MTGRAGRRRGYERRGHDGRALILCRLGDAEAHGESASIGRWSVRVPTIGKCGSRLFSLPSIFVTRGVATSRYKESIRYTCAHFFEFFAGAFSRAGAACATNPRSGPAAPPLSRAESRKPQAQRVSYGGGTAARLRVLDLRTPLSSAGGPGASRPYMCGWDRMYVVHRIAIMAHAVLPSPTAATHMARSRTLTRGRAFFGRESSARPVPGSFSARAALQ